MNLTIILIASLAAMGLGYVLRKSLSEKKTQDAEHRAKELIEQAKKSAENLRKEAGTGRQGRGLAPAPGI